MLGSAFVAEFARRGLPAWEAAAVSLARRDALTPWPMRDLTLTNADGDTAVLSVRSDVVAVGPLADYVRLPLRPQTAQSIANLDGSLLPTPWLVYQIWRSSPLKLEPVPMVPNLGADLNQWLAHSRIVDGQIRDLLSNPITGVPSPVGVGKHVVVSNLYAPGQVTIFGWYKPAPDVFDDGRPWRDPNRQPRQARSDVHSAEYLDYSHGIQLVTGTCVVNGAPMATEDLYRHPTLSSLVSNEGPLRVVRYPAAIPPAPNRPADVAVYPHWPAVVTTPGLADWAAGRGVARR